MGRGLTGDDRAAAPQVELAVAAALIAVLVVVIWQVTNWISG